MNKLNRSLKDSFVKKWINKSGESCSEGFLLKTYFRLTSKDDSWIVTKRYDDREWETNLLQPFPETILERYKTEKQAVFGHQKWLRIINTGPKDKRIKDCRSGMEHFFLPPESADILLISPKVTKKGTYIYRKKKQPEIWLRTIIKTKNEITENIVNMDKVLPYIENKEREEFFRGLANGFEKEAVDISFKENIATHIIHTYLNPYSKMWETKINLHKEDDGIAQTYTDQVEAIKGHKNWVQKVKENPKDIW